MTALAPAPISAPLPTVRIALPGNLTTPLPKLLTADPADLNMFLGRNFKALVAILDFIDIVAISF